MKNASRSAKALGLFVVLLVTTAASCRSTTINRILAEPQRYVNRDDVVLKGDVVESVSLLGHGAYRLDDGTGTIWIISRHGVPRRGARVRVEGRIRDVVDVSTIMRLPPEVGSGLVMVDARHRGE